MYGDELRKESERGSNGYLRKKMGSVLFERVEASRGWNSGQNLIFVKPSVKAL